MRVLDKQMHQNRWLIVKNHKYQKMAKNILTNSAHQGYNSFS